MQTHHDLGGTTGHGRVPPVDDAEPPFHHPWEGTAFVLGALVNRVAGSNLHAFRHALERLPESQYRAGYYQRWLAATELLLQESGVLAPGAVEARVRALAGQDVVQPDPPEIRRPTPISTGPGNLRTVERPHRFALGDRVRVRDDAPTTHTRRAGYVRGRTGTVVALPGAEVLPDAAAHHQGEDPQHVVTVEFASTELWGPAAEDFTLGIDLFEPYLEAAP